MTMKPYEDAELLYMGTLLSKGHVAPEIVSLLSPEDLSDPKLADILAAAQEVFREGGTIDGVVVGEKLKTQGKLAQVGGMAALSELMDFYEDPKKLPAFCEVIKREARARKLRGLAESLVRDLEEGKHPDEAQSSLEANLVLLGASHAEEEHDNLTNITMELMATLEVGVARGYPWPWEEMTKAVGYIMPGGFYLVTGFSNSGKSPFLRALSLGLIMEGKKVAYFSLEERGIDVLGLMACQAMGVSYMRFGQGYGLTEEEIIRIRDGCTDIYNTKNFILNKQKSWKPTQLLSKARQYADAGYEILIFDHAHLVNYPARSKEEKEHWVAQFAIQLNALLQEYDIAGMVAYQPRKPGQSGDTWRPASPDEVRGTSEVWNIARNTLSPYRPWVKVNHLGVTEKDYTTLLPIIAKPYEAGGQPVRDFFYIQPGKQRIGGPTGQPVVLAFDPVSARIMDR